MPHAIKVTEDNLDQILIYGAELGFNLSHLRDNLAYNAEDGEDTYLITDGNKANNNITFTDMTESGFRQLWTFAQQERPNLFSPIVRI